MSRYTSLAALHKAGLIKPEEVDRLKPVEERYAIALTQDMADLIDLSDPNDPIAAQFLPDQRELLVQPYELSDPTADGLHEKVKGVIHRYPDRVLLKLLHLCPVYCRFCFRRESIGPEGAGMLSEAQEDEALAYIAENPAIWEVIFTGGDPFMLSPRRLARVMGKLSNLAHVKIIRFHTRVPVVSPLLVTDEFVRALLGTGKAVYVVLHANHARELTDHARKACARLTDSGIQMLSQSVLLRGVNDTIESLEDLMRAFVEARIKPYYLHQLDPAPGTSHWHVPVEEGKSLMQDLRGRLSGLAQPLYVREQEEGRGKVPV